MLRNHHVCVGQLALKGKDICNVISQTTHCARFPSVQHTPSAVPLRWTPYSINDKLPAYSYYVRVQGRLRAREASESLEGLEHQACLAHKHAQHPGQGHPTPVHRGRRGLTKTLAKGCHRRTHARQHGRTHKHAAQPGDYPRLRIATSAAGFNPGWCVIKGEAVDRSRVEIQPVSDPGPGATRPGSSSLSCSTPRHDPFYPR